MTTSLNQPTIVGRCLLAAFVLTLLASGQAQDEWTSVKDIKGRTLSVQIESVKDGDVTFKTKQGKRYTQPITKFSVSDQLILNKWKPSQRKLNPVVQDSKLQLASQSAQETVFRSKHFEFKIVGAAKIEQVNEFAPVFEATYWAFEDLPLEITPSPSGTHFRTQLYLTESNFEVASREKLSEGEVAIYNLDQDIMLAPIEKLKPGPALVREIGFALLGKRLENTPPWLAVAISEYLAAAPLEDDALNLANPLDNMKKRLAEVYLHTGKTVPMLRPGSIFELDYTTLRGHDLEGAKGRSSALILFYFLAHLDDKGNGKGLQDYWRAIRTNATPEDAAEALLAGRTPEKLRDDLKVAYVTQRMRVAFIQ